MRVCLRAQAAILGMLGVYLVWADVFHGSKEEMLPQGLAFVTALVWPAVFYLMLILGYFRAMPAEDRSGGVPAAANVWPLALALGLYLPMMILLSSEPRKWMPPTTALPFFALWLFGACLRQWLRIGWSKDTSHAPAPSWGVGRWLEWTVHVFRPQVVLLMGSVILAFSLWEPRTAISLLNGSDRWITAEYGLGERINAATFILKYLGPLVYGGSLLVGLGTLVCLGQCKFSGARLKTSRLAAGLGIAAGILAIASITDYYFSWLSYLVQEDRKVQWALFGLLLLSWAVALVFAVMMVRVRRLNEESKSTLRALALLYSPLLLFDLAMSPFFVGELDSPFIDSPFILTTFLGLQFLAWGYVGLALAA